MFLNKTNIPKEILDPLFKLSGKRMKARILKVVYVATQGRGPTSVSGVAYDTNFCYKKDWEWGARGYNSSIERDRKLPTDRGTFKITFPAWHRTHKTRRALYEKHVDSLYVAQRVFWVMCHEWHHIREFQEGGHVFAKAVGNRRGRRPRHDWRPEERRAEAAVSDSQLKPFTKAEEEALLAFAQWMDKEQSI